MVRRVTVSLIAVALLVASSVASSAQSVMTRHVREAVANGRVQAIGRRAATETMNFDIVLPLRHGAELKGLLKELYDPASPSYRRFLTPQEFTERFGPAQADYDAVIQFAKANGLTVTGGSRAAMNVQLRGTVAAVESALHVKMRVYQHPTENRTFYGPDREPATGLSFKVWHISGLDNYSLPHSMARQGTLSRKNALVVSNAVNGSCPDSSYCGSDMRAAYYGETALTGAGQNLGLLEFRGFNTADLDTYYANVGQTLDVLITGVSVGGMKLVCVYPTCDDTEQILDITQAAGMAPGLAGLYVFVGRTDTALLSSMSTHLPLVGEIGSSWTWTPSDPATDDPYFEKFAAQGQSYFQAAGDTGYYTQGSGFVFPADDDYVTVVGGTDLQTGSAGGPWASETAWADGGGGYFTKDGIPIPAWQQLSGVINSSNEGSTTLRNSPDVAAEANNDFYVCSNQSGCETGWGGTSFATPMWAAYMALVNEQSLLNGNAQLGFINPTIYPLALGSDYADLFHDITTGSNGYPAVTGYDLATGWGSPNGTGLINALAGSVTGTAAVTLSPASLKWGKIAVGATGATKAVTVTNSGSAMLLITNIAASGDFTLTAVSSKQACGSTLLAGSKCIVKVTFTPTQTGLRTGTLTFTDSAANSPQTVALSGTGK